MRLPHELDPKRHQAILPPASVLLENPPPLQAAEAEAADEARAAASADAPGPRSAESPSEATATLAFPRGGPPPPAAADSGPAARPTHVLEVRGLRKLYGRKVAVADVSFSMSTGEVTGLLGPNGAGKTTVFYMVVGFIRPAAGQVFLDERRITRYPMYRRARAGIAYLPQEPSIFRKLSVEDNVRAILETRSDLDRGAKRRRLEELLTDFGIDRIRRQPAYTLSGGERRRTEIARALAIEPKFLLLDEPFAGIDPIAVHEIKGLVRKLSAAGIGVLITDHNVRDTLDITHRAHVINVGSIVVSGSREEVLASETARKIYLGEEFRM